MSGNKKYAKDLKKLIKEMGGTFYGQQKSGKYKYTDVVGNFFTAPMTPKNTNYPIKDAVKNLKAGLDALEDGCRIWQIIKFLYRKHLTLLLKCDIFIK